MVAASSNSRGKKRVRSTKKHTSLTTFSPYLSIIMSGSLEAVLSIAHGDAVVRAVRMIFDRESVALAKMYGLFYSFSNVLFKCI